MWSKYSYSWGSWCCKTEEKGNANKNWDVFKIEDPDECHGLEDKSGSCNYWAFTSKYCFEGPYIAYMGGNCKKNCCEYKKTLN